MAHICAIGGGKGGSDSIIAKKIFVVKYPYAPTTTDLKSLANRIVETRIEQPAIRKEHAYV